MENHSGTNKAVYKPTPADDRQKLILGQLHEKGRLSEADITKIEDSAKKPLYGSLSLSTSDRQTLMRDVSAFVNRGEADWTGDELVLPGRDESLVGRIKYFENKFNRRAEPRDVVKGEDPESVSFRERFYKARATVPFHDRGVDFLPVTDPSLADSKSCSHSSCVGDMEHGARCSNCGLFLAPGTLAACHSVVSAPKTERQDFLDKDSNA